jgi:monofunctional biosynthetic peptidoglycan transglycosylase
MAFRDDAGGATDAFSLQSAAGRLWSGIGDHGAACARIAFWAGLRFLVLAFVCGVALVSVLLVIMRVIDPPATPLMIGQMLSGVRVEHHWVPLDRISPVLIKAVIVSEDGQFCRHRGVDYGELEAALKQSGRNGLDQVRGASTISMQVTKNLFLWPSKDFVRKGLEIGITLLMEQLWSKRRILEVYLNIAEWGPGIFGAEAAARYHFRKPASRLSEREGALLAASLPNPIERVAGAPGPGTRRLAQIVETRARAGTERAVCVFRSGNVR